MCLEALQYAKRQAQCCVKTQSRHGLRSSCRCRISCFCERQGEAGSSPCCFAPCVPHLPHSLPPGAGRRGPGVQQYRVSGRLELAALLGARTRGPLICLLFKPRFSKQSSRDLSRQPILHPHESLFQPGGTAQSSLDEVLSASCLKALLCVCIYIYMYVCVSV